MKSKKQKNKDDKIILSTRSCVGRGLNLSTRTMKTKKDYNRQNNKIRGIDYDT